MFNPFNPIVGKKNPFNPVYEEEETGAFSVNHNAPLIATKQPAQINVAPAPTSPKLSVQSRPTAPLPQLKVAPPRPQPSVKVGQPLPTPKMNVAPAPTPPKINMGGAPLRPQPFNLPPSIISQAGPNSPEEEVGVWTKIAKTFLPKGIEDALGLNGPDGKPLTPQEAEDARQTYLRFKRMEENIAGVTKRKEKYVPPTTFGGKFGEVYKYKGYIANVISGFLAPAVGTTAEISGIQLDNAKLREWGEKYADQMLEKESKRVSAQSMADVPGALQGGLKDPRYYAKTISQALGFMTAIFSTSVAVTAVTKNPGAGAVAGFQVGAAIEASGAYRDMIDAGVTPEDANPAAQIYGTLASIIENATGIRPAGGLNQLTKDFAIDAAKSSAVKKFFKTWAQEGVLEEGSQQFVQNLVTKFVDNNQEIFEGIAEAMIGGLVGALPMAGGASIYSNYKNKQKKSLNEDIKKLNELFSKREGDITGLGGATDIENADIAGPGGGPLVIKHFTDDANINAILTEGFDTSRPPIHGVGGLEGGAKTAKTGGDILYFTTDTKRWDTALIYVGEDNGNIDRNIYNYETQKWEVEKNASKKLNLSPIESTIKDEAKILEINSLNKATTAIEKSGNRFNRYEMIQQLVDAGKKLGYDIVHISNPNPNAWGDPNDDPTKTGYKVLTGFSGNNDYFVLNKDVLKIKGAKTEEAPVKPIDTTKSVGTLNKEYEDSGPGHQRMNNFIDIMVNSETIFAEEGPMMKAVFQLFSDKILNDINIFELNPSLRRSSGRYNRALKRIQMQTGLANKEDRLSSIPAQTLLHEYGHHGWYTVLSEIERQQVTDIFKRLKKAGQRSIFSGHNENFRYYAQNAKEFWAQSFSDYVLENKVSDKQLEPVLKRVTEKLFKALKNLVNRKQHQAIKELIPFYEKIITGDQTTPLGKLAKEEPPSFKPKLQALIESIEKTTQVETPAVPEPAQKPLFSGTKEVPVEKIIDPLDIPPFESNPIDDTTPIYEQGINDNPPEIAEAIEPPEVAFQPKKKTPYKLRIGTHDKFRTPWRVMLKMGVVYEYRELIKAYEAYVKELPGNIDKITAWSNRVSKQSNERIFRFLDGEKVEYEDGTSLPIDLNAEEAQVAAEIKAWLEQWADRLGMAPDARISDYITHIFPSLEGGEMDEGILSVIDGKMAKSIYNPFLLPRKGATGYKKDTWAALDAYVKRATRKVNIDPALEEFNNATAHITEPSQVRYIEKRISYLNMRPTVMETGFDNTLKAVFGLALGPRPTMMISTSARRMISRSKIGGSLVSFSKNITQGINSFAELGAHYTIRGYIDLVKFGGKELKENNVLIDSFIQDRKYNAVKRWAEKSDKILFINMTASEFVNRGAAFYGAKAKFLDGKIKAREYKKAFSKDMPKNGYFPAEGATQEEFEQFRSDAIIYGKYVSDKTQFRFGPLDTPDIMSGPIAKTAFQFQTFSLKQAEFISDMITDKEIVKLTRYMAGSMLLFQFIGRAFGMSWDDSFKTFRFGKPPLWQFIEDLYKEGILGRDDYGNKLSPEQRWKGVGQSALTNVVPAGAQIKRTFQGIQTVKQRAGRNAAGDLQYRIKDTPYNYVAGALFGKYNLKENQQYFKERKDKLKGKSKSNTNPFNPI